MDIARYFLSLLCLVYILACIFMGIDTDFTPYSYILMLAVNIYMMICSRRNMMFLLVALVLFFCNYSIAYANYINYIEDFFTEVLSGKVSVISLNVLALFNCFLFLIVRWKDVPPQPVQNIFIDSDNKNIIILLLLSAALIFVFIFGYTPPSVEGGRGETSTMYEYSVILFILFFYYCGKDTKWVYWGVFLAVLFSLKGFAYGGRIEGIQILLSVYFMYFLTKIPMEKVLVSLFLLFLLMSIVGAVRGELLSGNFDVYGIICGIFERGGTLDTAYASYYCSETFVFVQERLTDEKIMEYFLSFLKSIFLGGGGNTFLPTITENYVYHQGGGILPFYFYFYLGIFGIFVSSLIVGLYLNTFAYVDYDSSGLLKCVFVLVISTVFRWYLYTPLIILRGVLFMIVFYTIFGYLSSFTKGLFCVRD